MSSCVLHWESQRVFLAVLRTGSLSGAARLLGIAQATARRRIEALEQSVGVSLFMRSPSGLTPTDSARALVDYVEAMAMAAEAFSRAASAEPDGDAGTVRITSGALLGVEVLPAMLRDIRRELPQLALELSVCNRLEALAQQEADVAVRIRRPTEQALVVRHVGDLQVGLYGSAELLQGGVPRSLADLVDFALIGPDRNVLERDVLREAGFPCDTARILIRSDDHLAQFAALKAGLGLGVCPRQLAERHGLLRVLPEQVDFSVDVWVAMHADRRRVQRIHKVFQMLADELKRYLE